MGTSLFRPLTWFVTSTIIILLLIGGLSLNAGAANTDPVLSDAGAYSQEGEDGIEYLFTVIYRDADGDEGDVLLYIDDNEPIKMRTIETDPVAGQYFEVEITDTKIPDDAEFRFSANDSKGKVFYLPATNEDPYLFGDFDGWGERPVLSSPAIFFDGDDWIFNVTYRDPDGNDVRVLDLILNDETYIHMETTDTDPLAGQNYTTRVLETQVNETTEFYFSVDDVNGSYIDLYDDDYHMFVVKDLYVQDDNGGGTNGGGNGGDTNDGDDTKDDSSATEGWFDNPEVLVGLIGLFIIIGGSAFGVYRRKKKQGRFSELLTKLDDVHTSYKMNPQRSETELEKIKATINEDLKKGVIDENNYTILKSRIDEIIGEIRQQAIRSEVSELPKDIELKLKDMLIDGKISREEYDRIMPAIKGSDMTKGDKEKMSKMVQSWVKSDVKK